MKRELWEAIKKITENENLYIEFETGEGEDYRKIHLDDDGWIVVADQHSNIYPLLPAFKYGHSEIENVKWKEVKEPVDFMTAFKALDEEGKRIYSIINGYQTEYTDNWQGNFSRRCIAKAEWYID